jgi:type IV pilus assembly protein PilA
MTRRRAQSGFTFIELMSVVVIMGILAVMILPNVKNYQARAKVSEAIIALTNCRTTVSEIYLAGGQLPTISTGGWGCEGSSKSKYVDAIVVSDDGVIKVTTSGAMGDLRIANQDITLAPLSRAGTVMSQDDSGEPVFRWRCGSTLDGTDSGLDLSFLPSSCRGS